MGEISFWGILTPRFSPDLRVSALILPAFHGMNRARKIQETGRILVTFQVETTAIRNVLVSFDDFSDEWRMIG